MNLVKKFSLSAFWSASLLMPCVALAYVWSPGDPLVPNCPTGCGFDELVQLGSNFMTFLIWLAAPVSVLLFTWAGFLWLTAGDNQGQISKAIKIFTDVAVGVIIMGVAWLLVYTALNTLLSDQYKSRLRLQSQVPVATLAKHFL